MLSNKWFKADDYMEWSPDWIPVFAAADICGVDGKSFYGSLFVKGEDAEHFFKKEDRLVDISYMQEMGKVRMHIFHDSLDYYWFIRDHAQSDSEICRIWAEWLKNRGENVSVGSLKKWISEGIWSLYPKSIFAISQPTDRQMQFYEWSKETAKAVAKWLLLNDRESFEKYMKEYGR